MRPNSDLDILVRTIEDLLRHTKASRVCGYKRRFLTLAEAEREMARQTNRARRSKVRRAYRCVDCRAWHLTSQKEWDARTG